MDDQAIAGSPEVSLAGAKRASGKRTPAAVRKAPVVTCSVGIMAYNEEANIADAIDAILTSPQTRVRVGEVIVVASGCTDRTVDIAAAIARKNARVKVIVQERREGKASAINLFINESRSPVLLMVSADVVVTKDTVDALLGHFLDPTVGMVGGHPVPVNDESTFLGHAVHLLWRLHDRLAREAPKLGEIVAFRNVVPSIPLDTAVDEISIQALITQLGYRVVYEPDAIVFNRGPSTVSDFLRQRRRIYAGHLRVRHQQGYAASTMSVRRVAQSLRGSGSFSTPKAALWTVCTIGLEGLARLLGHYDRLRRQSHQVWEAVLTTKDQVAESARAPGHQNVLVFHIVDHHRQQLRLGAHASRQLTHEVLRRVRDALGSVAEVTLQREGIIVAQVSGDSKGAERAARELVRTLDSTRVGYNGNREGVPVKLGFGMLTFSQSDAAAVAESAELATLATAGAYSRAEPSLQQALAELGRKRAWGQITKQDYEARRASLLAPSHLHLVGEALPEVG